MFKVKTLAVWFSAYPREMKHIPRNLNLSLLVSMEMEGNGAIHSHARARGLSMRTHLTAVEPEVAFLGADQNERSLWGRE